jgi:DNA polymerase-3 subunit gamma/tau
VRALQETVHYAAQRSPFKVYIIDEVHMLSTAAFNALLKTLEEPPAHVVFVFATTEMAKVPETIQSRCQAFYLKKLTFGLIRDRLAAILAREGVRYEPEALALVAREGRGSMRDALTLLDQAIALGDGAVTLAALGPLALARGAASYLDLVEALVARDQSAVLGLVDALDAQGVEFTSVVEELAASARHAFVVRELGAQALDTGLLGLTDAELGRLVEVGAKAAPLDLNRLFRCLMQCRLELSGGTLDRFVLENNLLEWCLDPGLPDVDELLARVGGGSASGGGRATAPASRAPQAPASRAPQAPVRSSAVPAPASAGGVPAPASSGAVQAFGGEASVAVPTAGDVAALASAAAEPAARPRSGATGRVSVGAFRESLAAAAAAAQAPADAQPAPADAQPAPAGVQPAPAGAQPTSLGAQPGASPAPVAATAPTSIPAAAPTTKPATGDAALARTFPSTWRALLDAWRALKPLQARKLEELHALVYEPARIVLGVPETSFASKSLFVREEQAKIRDQFKELFGFNGQLTIQTVGEALAEAEAALDAALSASQAPSAPAAPAATVPASTATPVVPASAASTSVLASTATPAGPHAPAPTASSAPTPAPARPAAPSQPLAARAAAASPVAAPSLVLPETVLTERRRESDARREKMEREAAEAPFTRDLAAALGATVASARSTGVAPPRS